MQMREKIHPLSKHFIDVGASSREDCPVEVGDAAGFLRPFFAQGKRLVSKAMDDRIGCVVAIEAMKRMKSSPHDVYTVFSVQEEVGTRGAVVSANGIDPDVGIALDVTMTGDIPECLAMDVHLGKGPAIKVKDAGMIAHVGLVREMKARAKEAGIPYQLEVLTGGSTVTHHGGPEGFDNNDIALFVAMVGLWFIRDILVGTDYGTNYWLIGGGVVAWVGAIVIAIKRRRLLTFSILAGTPEVTSGAGPGTLLTEGPYT